MSGEWKRRTALIGLLTAVLGALLLGGCSSVPTPKEAFSELTPRPGYARLYLYREKKFIGMAAKPTVTVDGVNVGMLRNGTYIALYLAPRSHDIKTEFSLLYAPIKGSTASVSVAADQEIFVRFDIDMTELIPTQHLVYSSWQTGFDIPGSDLSRSLIAPLIRADSEADLVLRNHAKVQP